MLGVGDVFVTLEIMIVPFGMPFPSTKRLLAGTGSRVVIVLSVVLVAAWIVTGVDGGVYAFPSTSKSSGKPGPETLLPTCILLTTPEVFATCIILVVAETPTVAVTVS